MTHEILMETSVDCLQTPVIVELPENSLDAANAQHFKSSVASLIQPGVKLIFDMGRTRFVDSSGLGAIVGCLRQVRAAGGELRLCAMTTPVRALFELVRMHKVFEILNSREEALRSFEIQSKP
jgi:anti-sigma B factor antagonist